MRVIDLKSNSIYIDQYVELRNYYKELLMTDQVTIEDTKKWLEAQDVEVRIIVQKNEVLGAIVLYVDKNNEIAIFVKKKGEGLGVKLLEAIIDVANKRNIQYLRAVVRADNRSAKSFFAKNGFVPVDEYIKKYKKDEVPVIEFIKWIK